VGIAYQVMEVKVRLIFFKGIFTRAIKVRKSQKQYMLSFILLKNEQKITILSIFSLGNTQESFFLGRIEDNYHNLLSRLSDH
jgi:hypothetical protein